MEQLRGGTRSSAPLLKIKQAGFPTAPGLDWRDAALLGQAVGSGDQRLLTSAVLARRHAPLFINNPAAKK